MDWKQFIPDKTNRNYIFSRNPNPKPVVSTGSRLNQTLKILGKWTVKETHIHMESSEIPGIISRTYADGILKFRPNGCNGAVPFAWNKFYKHSREQKQELIDTVFGGKTRKEKALVDKQSETKSKLKGILETLDTVIDQLWVLFYLTQPYQEIDLENNRVKIGGQWRKWSKELRKFLIPHVGVTKADEITQQISTVFSSKKEIKIVWSIEPEDFLLQSAGTTWTSCHRTVLYPGGFLCYQHRDHPWIGQSLDKVSTIAYIKDPYTGYLKARMMVYINPRTQEAAIGRHYPSGTATAPLVEYITYHLTKKGFTVHPTLSRTDKIFEKYVGRYTSYGDFNDYLSLTKYRDQYPYAIDNIPKGVLEEIVESRWT